MTRSATVDTLPVVRKDMLPEASINNGYYADNGCEVISGKCTECPLPRCIEDLPASKLAEERNIEIVRLRVNGKPVKEISVIYGIATRTVHRIVQKASE